MKTDDYFRDLIRLWMVGGRLAIILHEHDSHLNWSRVSSSSFLRFFAEGYDYGSTSEVYARALFTPNQVGDSLIFILRVDQTQGEL